MNDIHDEEENSIYEIGYLIASSVPEEKVPAEAEALKKIITDAGASLISEEAPHRESLAYTMRRKTVSGGYEKYDTAYFGWVKFEISPDKIEALKKSIEVHPSVLRMLLTSTVRENTYLGKRAPAFTEEFSKRPVMAERPRDKEVASVPVPSGPPASIEEMDKSIDEMVKEVN